jgi:hypothetical protein
MMECYVYLPILIHTLTFGESVLSAGEARTSMEGLMAPFTMLALVAVWDVRNMRVIYATPDIAGASVYSICSRWQRLLPLWLLSINLPYH